MLQFENEHVSYFSKPIYFRIYFKIFAANSTLQLHIEISHESNSSKIDDSKETQNFKDSNSNKEIIKVEQIDFQDVNNCDSHGNENNKPKNIESNMYIVEKFLNNFECNQCHKFFTKIHSFKKHSNQNTSESCIWPFKFMIHIRHFKSESLENCFKCNQCKKQFTAQSNAKKQFIPMITNQNKTFQVF